LFALKGGLAGQAGRAVAPGIGGFVLPKALRRPVRHLGRWFAGDVEIPRHATSILVAGFLGVSAIYGAILGGHLPQVVQSVSARTGFAIEAVRVTGNVETSEIDILEKLGLDGWTSLVGFDAEEARLRVAELPWVSEASVRKVYPSTVEIIIAERKAAAIWQNGRELSLVDAEGRVIAPFRKERHATLPLVIGLGAATGAQAFLAKVARHPELAPRVTAYIRVAERRWDLRLESGITVKLPANDEERALADLVELERTQGILGRDIAQVDMRFDDRLVIRLTPEAAMKRDATLKERTNGAYKPEKRV
jgi:cell division protein FtsQ